MDAIAIVYTLTDMEIVSECIQNKVTAASGSQQQNEILYGHLKKTCTKEALVNVCNTMMNAKGNPRMNSFGSDMLSKLSGKCYLCPCMHVLHTSMCDCLYICMTSTTLALIQFTIVEIPTIDWCKFSMEIMT